MLEDSLREEHAKRFSNYSFQSFLKAYHNDAKVLGLYFGTWANDIKLQPLEYVGPTNASTGFCYKCGKSFSIRFERNYFLN